VAASHPLVVDAHANGKVAGAIAQSVVIAVGIAIDAGDDVPTLGRQGVFDVEQGEAVGPPGAAAGQQDRCGLQG